MHRRLAREPGGGDQLGDIRSHGHGFESAHVRAPRIAQRKTLEQVTQGHQGQPQELSSELWTILGRQGKLQHRNVGSPVRREAALPNDMRGFEGQPFRFCIGFRERLIPGQQTLEHDGIEGCGRSRIR